MNDPEIYMQLQKEDLFLLFRAQLKKDFEGAGLNGDFTDTLPNEYHALVDCLVRVLDPVIEKQSVLAALLYRIDITEKQLQRYSVGATVNFTGIVAELIIKRILQKVILKKTFSK